MAYNISYNMMRRITQELAKSGKKNTLELRTYIIPRYHETTSARRRRRRCVPGNHHQLYLLIITLQETCAEKEKVTDMTSPVYMQMISSSSREHRRLYRMSYTVPTHAYTRATHILWSLDIIHVLYYDIVQRTPIIPTRKTLGCS